MNKLKSRKLWVAVISAALLALAGQLGVDAEHAQYLLATAIAYILGQSYVDGKASG